MRVLVYGGRDYKDWSYLKWFLDEFSIENIVDVVIEGDAPGADRMAGSWAKLRDIPLLKFPARWDIYGKAAGSIRNQLMIDEGKPDIAVEFPGGKGTADMQDRLHKAGIKVILASKECHEKS